MTIFDYLGIADDGTVLVSMDENTYNTVLKFLMKEAYYKAWRDCQDAHETGANAKE